MKKYNKKMRFEFRFSMEGYGHNVKQALESALDQALMRMDEFDYELLERDEVIAVIDDNYENKK